MTPWCRAGEVGEREKIVVGEGFRKLGEIFINVEELIVMEVHDSDAQSEEGRIRYFDKKNIER
jgi:hypothetical protein